MTVELTIGLHGRARSHTWSPVADDPTDFFHRVRGVPEPYQAGTGEDLTHPTPRPSIPWRFLPAQDWNWVNRRAVR